MTASRLLNMGMRLPNSAVRPAPSMLMAMFHIAKQITEAPMPRYNIEATRPIFHSATGDWLCSHTKNGSNKTDPNKNVTNKKLTGEIADGFFLTKMLYVAKQKAARSIHASPDENFRAKRFLKFPFDNRKSMPAMQITIPNNFIHPTRSFKKIRAMIMDMMGEEVVPINARLIAVV